MYVLKTNLTLSEKGSLSGLVLGHFVGSVLSALLSLAVSISSLGDVDLYNVYKLDISPIVFCI